MYVCYTMNYITAFVLVIWKPLKSDRVSIFEEHGPRLAIEWLDYNIMP